MIEFFVLALLILFAAYLTLNFIGYGALILNLVILAAIYFLIAKDLKNKEDHKFYIFSLLITGLALIFSNFGILNFMQNLLFKLSLSVVTASFFLVYFFANLMKALVELSNYAKGNFRR